MKTFLLTFIALVAVFSVAVELTAAVIGALHGAWWLTLMALFVAASTVAVVRVEWPALREYLGNQLHDHSAQAKTARAGVVTADAAGGADLDAGSSPESAGPAPLLGGAR